MVPGAAGGGKAFGLRASGRDIVRPGKGFMGACRQAKPACSLCSGNTTGFSQTSITSFLVLYLQEDLDFTLGAAGAGLTVLMAAGAAGRVAWGLISDRFFRGNRQKPMVILCLTASTGALATAFLNAESARWLVYSLSALLGFTFMGWNAVFLAYCAETAGLMLTMVSAGVVIGPPVFGFTADKAGYFWGWLILFAFGLAGAISFVWSVMRQPRVAED